MYTVSALIKQNTYGIMYDYIVYISSEKMLKTILHIYIYAVHMSIVCTNHVSNMYNLYIVA